MTPEEKAAQKAIEVAKILSERSPESWCELIETVSVSDIMAMAEVLANTDLEATDLEAE